ncbi:uncharacterized protein K452DRAFT_286465 [Aplosporella prunicola CBS 121167]|uniref:Uncharacterized protein n=1 Tax=Aplosporella prunicola CBS 121167 TaxID=1176127 RepID=A0A6A6BJU2_9PEZI|nr:uncharacterized protein K452DRAFT_286465 [Aplosporella prunicola CBS 121167]KAF2142841.1 hypothetical protein K452DRAFT_286465 [Aplosporella prunicola CBS 121167]
MASSLTTTAAAADTGSSSPSPSASASASASAAATAAATAAASTSDRATTSAAPTSAIPTRALTTTFTPAANCSSGFLTQLAAQEYRIWGVEPVPVPNSTFSECFPSEFLRGYTSTASSSVAPFLSPLVCPLGWHTAGTWEGGYVACCESGYLLAYPSSTVDTRRPAYGGTCYSQFTVGKTVNVTVYDSASLTATAQWYATSTLDQAYGHVLDGIGVKAVSSSDDSSLSGGAIAGIVIGALAGAALILGLLLLLLARRRRRIKRAAAAETAAGERTLPPEADGVDAAILEKSTDGAVAEVDGTGRAIAEKDAGRDGAAELEGGVHDGAHELESPLFELDGEAGRLEAGDGKVEESVGVQGREGLVHESPGKKIPPPAYE